MIDGLCPLPNYPDLERAVFASILFSGAREILADLSPELFYSSDIRPVIQYIIETGCDDVVILSEKFPDSRLTIAECTESVGSMHDTSAALSLLREAAYRRMGISSGEKFVTAMIRPDGDYNGATEEHISEVSSAPVFHKRKPVTIHKAVSEFVDELSASEEDAGYIRTGLADLDVALGPIEAGELVVIAARPGMGKSSFALQIARHAAMAQGIEVVIFSLEMSRSLCAGRIASAASGVEFTALKRRYATREALTKFGAWVESVSKAPIIIDDNPGITFNHIDFSLKAHPDAKLCIIDHLGLMSFGKSKAKSRNDQIGEVTVNLCGLAKSRNMAVILVSQLSREVERRSPPVPVLSDLRDSGNIEQDAHRVLMLYRPCVYEKSKSENESYCYITKNRNGQTGKVPLFWDGKCMTFRNAAKDFGGF